MLGRGVASKGEEGRRSDSESVWNLAEGAFLLRDSQQPRWAWQRFAVLCQDEAKKPFCLTAQFLAPGSAGAFETLTAG